MNLSIRCVALSLLLLLCTGPAVSQQRIIRMGPGGKEELKGGFCDIPELGALIVKDGDNLKVEHVMAPEQRPKEYADVSIQEGDVILLLNNKRVKTIRDLEDQYKAVAVGAEIKLGFERGQEMMISAFKKADPKNLPQRKTMIINTNGPADNIRPLPAIGLILEGGKSGVAVNDVLEGAVKSITDAGIAKGDKLVSVDGKAVKSLPDFSDAFDKVEAGKHMQWVMRHGGSNVSLDIVKPESRGMVIIKRKQ